MNSSELVQLMRESVITQAIITVLALATTCYLVASGHAVPEQLWTIDGLVVGFYFGGKVQSAAMRIARKSTDG